MKKFLALVLAFMMAMSLMVTANAVTENVTFPDSESVIAEFQEDVTVMSGMGVIKGHGDTGTFAPKANVTRAQMAAIVYRLATGDASDSRSDLYKEYNSFKDVKSDAWYAGYVGYCADAGYILGYPDGSFKPNAEVSGYAALAMVLRAMGYNQPGHNFEGSGWKAEVGSIATQRQMLVNINKSIYAHTLNQAAPRELVAEMAFQGATKAMVEWTNAFGYQTTSYSGSATTGEQRVTNPSLGKLYYGLTRQTGIVVGNQATGELWTKVGVDATAKFAADGSLTGVTVSQDVGDYVYTTTGAMVVSPAAPDGNVTLSYNFNTGLDLFGHKVNVWYDYRSTSGNEAFGGTINVASNYKNTYAVIDKANLVKTVFANKGPSDGLFTAQKATTAGATSVYTAAVNAGFSKYSNPQWGSDRYSQMGQLNAWVATTTVATAVQSKVGMYTVISNNADLKADVVISLNQEVAVINQRNTTINERYYIYLNNGNSGFGDVLSGGKKGLIYDSQLSPASDKTLGDVVTAHQIVGTNSAALVAGKAAVSRAWVAAGVTLATTDVCWYQTDKLEPAFTGTIATYKLGSDLQSKTWFGKSTAANNIVTNVTLTDGTVLDLSGITGSQTDYGFDAAQESHLINGPTLLTSQNTYAGVTYSFYKDAVGRFIGVGIPNEYQFLYTTFADYEIGALGTGTIGYYAYGVDWDGNIVKTNNQIKSITEPVDTTAGPGKPAFDDLTAGKVAARYPGAGTNTLALGYNLLPVTIKDQGTSVVGNQIKEGANTRFMMDPNGNMTWYTQGAKYGQRFLGWWDASLGTPAASYTWTITKTDAANGFKRVYNHDVAVTNPTTAIAAPAAVGDNTDYLLTNSTKFIVVTGSGTDTLAVKTYNGISELVGDASYAEISIKSDFKGDNVYFLTSAQKYGNTDTNDNHTIDTVILSNTNLNNYTNQSLFFSEPGNVKTNVKLAGYTNGGVYGTVEQYKLYQNGKVGYYWISDTQSTGNAANPNTANGTAKKGDFYTLTPIGEVNGQPIYKATIQQYALVGRMCDVDELYDYIVVNELSTAAFGPLNANVVKKVSGANVTVALGDNNDATFKGLFPNGINITDVQTLNNAVSMGEAGASGNLYSIKVAFEYSGVDVSNIYVTAVTATP